MSAEQCQACAARHVRQDAAAIAASIAAQLALEPHNLVAEMIRQRRLAICGTCPHQQASTCGLCGCYVAFRTALANKACPIGAWQAEDR